MYRFLVKNFFNFDIEFNAAATKNTSFLTSKSTLFRHESYFCRIYLYNLLKFSPFTLPTYQRAVVKIQILGISTF